MKKMKNWLLASGLFTLLVTLSGCVSVDKQGIPTGKGFVYNFLVKPVSFAINYLVTNYDWNYAVAIILITVIVRAIILPLGLHQTKKANYQSEKMNALKPQMEAIQRKTKEAVTQEEQMAASMELQKLYKDNNINIMGGMGCLPLLIQMPIFTALFYAVKFTEGVSGASFMGINLGEPSLIFTALAGISYFLQGFISMIGIPEEQKKQMMSMTFMSPLMIIFMSFRSPAAVTLYWVISGLFSCVQTLITNLYYKPKIKAQVAEELRKNPPKPVEEIIVQEKPKQVAPKKKLNAQTATNKKGRNAGKQQNRK